MMKRKCILFVVIAAILLCFLSCGRTYDEKEIISLTSIEVVEKYGNFDRKQGYPNEDGLYCNCACGYLIKPKKVGYFGTTPPEYFMIFFDETGVAKHCRYEKVV